MFQKSFFHEPSSSSPVPYIAVIRVFFLFVLLTLDIELSIVAVYSVLLDQALAEIPRYGPATRTIPRLCGLDRIFVLSLDIAVFIDE